MAESYAYPLKSITPLPDYKVWAEFSDGTAGVADLSWVLERPNLSKLRDPDFFATVKLGPGGCLTWDDEIDVGWEGIFTQLTGKDWPEAFPPSEQTEFIEMVRASITRPPDAFVEFSDGTSGEIRLPRFVLDKTVSPESHKRPCEIAINTWGNIIWKGREFDGDAMYLELSGKDIDTASEAWSR